MRQITVVLDETEAQLAPLERDVALAEWDAAIGGDDGAEERMIASSLALSERAVEGRLRRARQNLRREIERDASTDGDVT